MPAFTAKDVQALRQQTGAGMMDAKKALTEADGDMTQAAKALREKGLAKAAGRSDRDNAEGVVAVATSADAAAMVLLRCETDFTAKAAQFVSLAQKIAEAVAADGSGAAETFADQIDDLKVAQKENVALGDVVRIPTEGRAADTYLHMQDGRGVNGVIVVLDGGTPELAHDVAIHAAFTQPAHVSRDQVPAAEVDEERDVLLAQTKKEGKPEAAWDKIVDGKLTGWFRERVLLEQKFVRDEKVTVADLLGEASIAEFSQIVVG